MPRRSKVTELPKGVRDWLHKNLKETGFSGYQALADELAKMGYSISKSALHRYGQQFEEKLEAMQLSSEMAKEIVQVTPDDEGAMNEALLRLCRERLFTLLLNLGIEEKDAKAKLTAVARAVADISRATVSQNKYRQQIKERTEAAAEQVTQAVMAGGMSEETVRAIKEDILGIAAG